jgi:hypothetical protein
MLRLDKSDWLRGARDRLMMLRRFMAREGSFGEGQAV